MATPKICQTSTSFFFWVEHERDRNFATLTLHYCRLDKISSLSTLSEKVLLKYKFCFVDFDICLSEQVQDAFAPWICRLSGKFYFVSGNSKIAINLAPFNFLVSTVS